AIEADHKASFGRDAHRLAIELYRSPRRNTAEHESTLLQRTGQPQPIAGPGGNGNNQQQQQRTGCGFFKCMNQWCLPDYVIGRSCRLASAPLSRPSSVSSTVRRTRFAYHATPSSTPSEIFPAMSRYRPPQRRGSLYITPEGMQVLRAELHQLWK